MKGLIELEKGIRIAIDGPAAAGKSTIAKLAAETLGYTYIDTGAMYRAITYKALRENINIGQAEDLAELLNNTEIKLVPSLSGQAVLLDGEDVSEEIRTREVTSAVSEVSAHRQVREGMVKRQQEMVESGSVVMDGRDIGTHVIPDAELKIFMSASVEERAKRRQLENEKRGIPSSIEVLQQEIELRDKIDSEREASPLKKAEDAIYIDTSHMSIEQAAGEIIRLARERIERA
jgi:cytidylate kinase